MIDQNGTYVENTSNQAIRDHQTQARKASEDFLAEAAKTMNPKVAADWSLAAKNAMSVVTSCETVLKLRRGGR